MTPIIYTYTYNIYYWLVIPAQHCYPYLCYRFHPWTRGPHERVFADVPHVRRQIFFVFGHQKPLLGVTRRTAQWHNVRADVLGGHLVRGRFSATRRRRDAPRSCRNGSNGNRYELWWHYSDRFQYGYVFGLKVIWKFACHFFKTKHRQPLTVHSLHTIRCAKSYAHCILQAGIAWMRVPPEQTIW